MELLLQRTAKKDKYTIGKFYINGQYFCDTIEDPDRGLNYKMPLSQIQKIKVYGNTAIPTGTYKVTPNYCSKFASRVWATKYKGILPLLHNVPGYSGVYIHVGNTANDTLGCPLLGENKVVGKVINSSKCFQKFMDNYFMPATKKGETITLTIK